MPANLERCVEDVKAQIASGKLPKGSSPWAICVASLEKSKKIAKNPKGSKHQWRLSK